MSNVPRTPGKDGRPVSPFGPTVAEREARIPIPRTTECECPLVWGGHGDPKPDPRRPEPTCPQHGHRQPTSYGIVCPVDGRPATEEGDCPKCGRILERE
jgi:hypothetical protein